MQSKIMYAVGVRQKEYMSQASDFNNLIDRLNNNKLIGRENSVTVIYTDERGIETAIIYRRNDVFTMAFVVYGNVATVPQYDLRRIVDTLDCIWNGQ